MVNFCNSLLRPVQNPILNGICCISKCRPCQIWDLKLHDSVVDTFAATFLPSSHLPSKLYIRTEFVTYFFVIVIVLYAIFILQLWTERENKHCSHCSLKYLQNNSSKHECSMPLLQFEEPHVSQYILFGSSISERQKVYPSLKRISKAAHSRFS